MLPCHRNNGCEAAQQELTNKEKIQPLLQGAELVKCRAQKIIFNAGISSCNKGNEMFVEKFIILLIQKGASNCILLLVTIISVAITKYHVFENVNL